MNAIRSALLLCLDRALFAAVGSLGAVNLTNVSGTKEWTAIGITAGLTAAATLVRSLSSVLGPAAAAPLPSIPVPTAIPAYLPGPQAAAPNATYTAANSPVHP